MKQRRPAVILLPPPKPVVRSRFLSPLIYSGVVLVAVAALFFSYLVTQTREVAFESAAVSYPTAEHEGRITPFPLGVDPHRKKITEQATADTYFETHSPSSRSLALASTHSWFGRMVQHLAMMEWYQNLATPTGRMLVIASGDRKEELADHFSKLLNWSASDRAHFLDLVATSTPGITEGTYFPSTYVVARSATPEDVALLVTERFKSEVLSRYKPDIDAVVPLNDALTIASLLEREAYDFDDMRLISGVIWNRLFIGMNLQIDATLQYAKANEGGSQWWPNPVPKDKELHSPYNTYKVAGLPPTPIANPSLDSILAALNPKKTNCLFYFHDAHAGFHCAATYEEHVRLLKQYYGQGK